MGNLIWGKNEKVNLTVPHKTNSLAQKPNFSHGVAQRPLAHNKKQEPHTITHNDRKLPFYFSLQVVLQYGIFFDESSIKNVYLLFL